MTPPDESQDTAEPPNVFRQALVFYISALFAMALSLAPASILAAVLDVPLVVFMWLFTPLAVSVVLFILVDDLIRSRMEAGYPQDHGARGSRDDSSPVANQ